MKIVNRQSLELGNELRNNTLEKDRERFKNTQLPTQLGYIFESTVAKKNNLRCIAIGSPERYITDRMTKWKGKINDQVTDIQIVNSDLEKSMQLKCCKNPYYTVREITKSDEFGFSKYGNQILCVPSDQFDFCKQILLERINNNQNITNNSEISIFDTDNPNLPGYTGFSSGTNRRIWILLRDLIALDGLTKAEDILAPSYSEALDVVQYGSDARVVKREIWKTNFVCQRNLTLKNFSKEVCMDSYFVTKSENPVTGELLIRYGKSAISSLITGFIEHELGKNEIPISDYSDSALGSLVRSALHCSEAAVRSALKPGDKGKNVKKLHADMQEEVKRLSVKIIFNYLSSKIEVKSH